MRDAIRRNNYFLKTVFVSSSALFIDQSSYRCRIYMCKRQLKNYHFENRH
ncbi:hypothetical protein HanOQP8_Chr16g0620821 [Helianthus annuus]|nr:hypothetical protein HanHA89_Chr16g0665471 [Helianthus annuus]KAJ0641254.1 hypothetical protein HanLR1_Chr16g0625121 [Helianthus annuus]KAJ0645165.1 hypothetical protein HanOQP8_Chr16g0620821 [Helianthus annuus]